MEGELPSHLRKRLLLTGLDYSNLRYISNFHVFLKRVIPSQGAHTRPVTAVWDPLDLDNRWCFCSQGGKKQDLNRFPFKSRLNRYQHQHTPAEKVVRGRWRLRRDEKR